MKWSLLVFVILDIMVVPRTMERRIISITILIYKNVEIISK